MAIRVFHVFATLLLRGQLSWCVGVCLLNRLLPNWTPESQITVIYYLFFFDRSHMRYKMANENDLHFKSALATLSRHLGVSCGQIIELFWVFYPFHIE